jgi:SAM-dependent methyltransferase
VAIEEIYRRPEDYELELLAREVGDLPFWQETLRRERPARALEIGCGCGRLALPLARQGSRQGYTITGLEMEPAMLRRAQEHARSEAAATRLALRLALGDARDLDGALGAADDGRLFDVILMPYGVAHHLTKLDDQLSVWRGARRWLRAGGLLAVDVTAPDLPRMAAGLEAATPRRLDLEARHAGRWLRRTVATRYHPATQMETLAFEYHIRAADGSTRHYRSDFDMRVYFPGELELLFRATGFALERLLGSYDGEPYGPSSPLLLCLGRAI